jgi:hypothetical protein
METKTSKSDTFFTSIGDLFTGSNGKFSTDKKNTFSNSIYSLDKDTTSSITSARSSLSTLESSASSSTSWWVIIFLILGLSFLGFNIFVYLAKGTQGLVDLFSPILQTIGYNTAVSTKKIINVSAKGLQNVSGSIADSTSSGPTPNPNTPANNSPTTTKGQDYTRENDVEKLDNSLNKALNSGSKMVTSPYTADESSSVTQSSKMTNKSGWCYIGEEKGFRSCISVGAADTCMSGDIFPTHDICVNPNLRP